MDSIRVIYVQCSNKFTLERLISSAKHLNIYIYIHEIAIKMMLKLKKVIYIYTSKDDCFIIFFSFQKTDAHTLTLFTKAKITRQALLIDIYL